MFDNIISQLSNYKSPNTSSQQKLSSSICTSSNNIVFSLNQDSITFTSISQSNDHPVKILPLIDYLNGQFDNILCTNNGELLVLTSSTIVATVSIPSKWFENGLLNPQGEDKLKLNIVYESKNPIIKVGFHPYHQFSLTILHHKSVLLLNLLTKINKIILSSDSNNFTSFSYGPDYEWLRFTLFLTTESGEIYYLCPILPSDALVPVETVKELWIWFYEKFCNISKADNKYLINYYFLCENFGTYEELVSRINNDEKVIRVGEINFIPSNFLETPFSLNNYSPSLNGPINFEGSKSKKITDISISCPYYQLNSEGDDSQNISSPTLTVIFDDSTVQVLLFNIIDDNSWIISPVWRNNLLEIFSLSNLPLSLVMCDVFIVDSSKTKSDNWKLISDPLYPWYFYATNSLSGQSVSIFSGFLYNSLKLNNSDYEEDKLVKSNCYPVISEMKQAISGSSVVYDPFYGHIMIHRFSSDKFLIVNLTLHSSICAYQTQLKLENFEDSTNLLKEKFNAQLSEENLRWIQLEGLFKKIKEGLLSIKPNLEVSIQQNASEESKKLKPEDGKSVLIQVASELEAKVITHLQDVASSNKFQLDILNKLYTFQNNIIQGNPESTSLTTNSDNEDHIDISLGLKKILEILNQKNESLKIKLNQIRENQEELKELAEASLFLAASQNKKLSAAEQKYIQELTDMNKKVQEMNEKINAIKLISSNIYNKNPYSAKPQHKFTLTNKLNITKPDLTLNKGISRVYLPNKNQEETFALTSEEVSECEDVFKTLNHLYCNYKEKIIDLEAKVKLTKI